uniref:hypothetical protein n=1 Tax=Thaumasiovibrio occultus TaxID=1891184 RepID=UPI000B3521DF|nr:hypothetical protein [Thaumasiovibrio occultus]
MSLNYQTLDWTPINPSGGSNYASHRLIGDARVSAFPCFTQVALFSVVGAAGLALLSIGMNSPLETAVAFIFAGLFFAGLSLVGFLHASSTFVIHTKPKYITFAADKLFTNQDDMLAFDDVGAVQLLKKKVAHETGEYWCFEVNVVLDNGERRLLLDHGDEAQICADAEKIADVLDTRLLDNLSQRR